MAENWTEVSEGYLLNRRETNVTGQRVFRRHDTGGGVGVGSLPAVGDTMVAEDLTTGVTGCLCRGYTVRFVGGHGGTPERTYDYSTEEEGYSSTGRSVPLDFEAESFEMTCQAETFTPDPNVPGGDYWSWGSSNEVRQSLTRLVPQTRFSIPFPQDMAASLTPYLKARLRDFIGRINAADFGGFLAGQVMLAGVTGGTFRNSEGAAKVAVMLHFECRVLGSELKASGSDNKDWLYVLSEATGLYAKPRTNTSTKYLYEEKSFGSGSGGLFETISAPP